MNSRIESRVGVRADSERIWEIVADLDGWSRWNPYEVQPTGAIAFGGAIRLTERLPDLPERFAAYGVAEWQPLAQLVLAEKRGWLFSAIRYIEIEELERGSCIVANGVIFSGLRGELFHDKYRKTIKTAYAEVGEQLRKLAEG